MYITMDKRNKKKRNKCLCWGICLAVVAAVVIVGILVAREYHFMLAFVVLQLDTTPIMFASNCHSDFAILDPVYVCVWVGERRLNRPTKLINNLCIATFLSIVRILQENFRCLYTSKALFPLFFVLNCFCVEHASEFSES